MYCWGGGGGGEDLREGEREKIECNDSCTHYAHTLVQTHTETHNQSKKESTPLGLRPIIKGTPQNILLLYTSNILDPRSTCGTRVLDLYVHVGYCYNQMYTALWVTLLSAKLLGYPSRN